MLPTVVNVGALLMLYVPALVPYFMVAPLPLVGIVTLTFAQLCAVPFVGVEPL